MVKVEIVEKVAGLINSAHPENVDSIYKYGNEEENEDFSDIALLVILKDASSKVLDLYQASLKKILKKHMLKITFFTLEELKNSLDVFPMEFLDMKESRCLITGKDHFKSLVIDSKNLRHQCEYVLRSNILKLREGYINPGRNINALVSGSIVSFIAVFRNLLRLNNVDIPGSNKELFSLLAEKLRFNKVVFQDVLENYNSKNVADLFPMYLQELEKIVIQVDKLDV
jgi:hypothetical protein